MSLEKLWGQGEGGTITQTNRGRRGVSRGGMTPWMGECQYVSGMLEQNTLARCTGVRNMGFNIWE